MDITDISLLLHFNLLYVLILLSRLYHVASLTIHSQKLLYVFDILHPLAFCVIRI